MILIIIVVLIFCIIYYLLKNQKETFVPLNENEKYKLLQCMNDVHNCFNKNNVWYILAFGSLLGAVRHHDIIPWDDDMDLLILKNDQEKIDKLIIPELEQLGYKIEKTWKLYKIYSDNEHCIDLFFIIIDNNIVYRATTEIENTNVPNKDQEWWWKYFGFSYSLIEFKKLFNFNKYKFYSTTNAKNLLIYWYGEDCLTICKTPSYDHTTNTYIDEKIISCNKLPALQL